MADTKDIQLAKLIYSHFEPLVLDRMVPMDQLDFERAIKQSCLAAAREILGKDLETGKRDLIFEALCEAMGADWHQMPKHEAAKYNVAAKQLRAIAATPADVLRRARRYEYRHPDWELTPTSLISHWSTLENDKTRRVPPPNELYAGNQSPLTDVAEVLVGPPPDFLQALRRGGLKSMDLTDGPGPDTLIVQRPEGQTPTPDTEKRGTEP